jgi:hypothetical protein
MTGSRTSIGTVYVLDSGLFIRLNAGRGFIGSNYLAYDIKNTYIIYSQTPKV